MRKYTVIFAITVIYADPNSLTELDIHLIDNNCENGCLNWTITVENDGDILDENFDLTTDYDSYTSYSNLENILIRGNHVSSPTEGAVTEIPEKDPPMPPMDPGMGGMGGMM